MWHLVCRNWRCRGPGSSFHSICVIAPVDEYLFLVLFNEGTVFLVLWLLFSLASAASNLHIASAILVFLFIPLGIQYCVRSSKMRCSSWKNRVLVNRLVSQLREGNPSEPPHLATSTHGKARDGTGSRLEDNNVEWMFLNNHLITPEFGLNFRVIVQSLIVTLYMRLKILHRLTSHRKCSKKW